MLVCFKKKDTDQVQKTLTTQNDIKKSKNQNPKMKEHALCQTLNANIRCHLIDLRSCSLFIHLYVSILCVTRMNI